MKINRYMCICCSAAKSCLTLCNPMDCNIPGFPVLHYLLEFAQTHTHWLSQWYHWTISSSVSPFSSCLQSFLASGPFQWVSSWHQVAKVLELQLQSFQWIFRVDFLWDWLLWSPCCPRTLKSLLWHHNLKASILQHSAFLQRLKVYSVQLGPFADNFGLKCRDRNMSHQLWETWLIPIHGYWKKHSFDYMDLCWQSDVSAF